MKRIFVYVLIAAAALAGTAGCTNDEGGEDLDVITPVDSTQSRLPVNTGAERTF